MQTLQLNDSWVIVDGLDAVDNEVNDDDTQRTAEYSPPDWFWTGRRWSSQSARSKLFSSKRDAQSEMRRIRTSSEC